MIGPCNSVLTDHWNVEVDEFEYEFVSHYKMCCPCVGVEENANLTNAQKKVFLWHQKSGINMHHIQELMHVHVAKEPNGKYFLMPIVI